MSSVDFLTSLELPFCFVNTGGVRRPDQGAEPSTWAWPAVEVKVHRGRALDPTHRGARPQRPLTPPSAQVTCSSPSTAPFSSAGSGHGVTRTGLEELKPQDRPRDGEGDERGPEETGSLSACHGVSREGLTPDGRGPPVIIRAPPPGSDFAVSQVLDAKSCKPEDVHQPSASEVRGQSGVASSQAQNRT
ncbi:unnamed protein product [Gadus morhua 'NCC']